MWKKSNDVATQYSLKCQAVKAVLTTSGTTFFYIQRICACDSDSVHFSDTSGARILVIEGECVDFSGVKPQGMPGMLHIRHVPLANQSRDFIIPRYQDIKTIHRYR